MLQVTGGKQIIAKQAQVHSVFRFIGKLIYLKSSSPQYGTEFVRKIVDKGGKVQVGRGWTCVDMIGDNKVIKLGNLVFDIDEGGEEGLKVFLVDFFSDLLKAQGFQIEVSDL